MNHQPDNPPQHEPESAAQLPVAVLLRLAADDELDASAQSQLQAHLRAHPEDQTIIEAERALRRACSRACSGDANTPPSLCSRIDSIIAQSRQHETQSASPASTSPASTPVVDDEPSIPQSLAAQTRSRRFWVGQTVVRYAALAAMIALVALVAFQVGRSSDSWKPMGTQIAAFARHEHTRCLTDMPVIESKFTIKELDKVPSEFAAITGKTVTLPAILHAQQAGLEFIDAGQCHLPGKGKSMQIRFRTADNPDEILSLWVQDDDGQLPLKEGTTYTTGSGRNCVRLWRVDGIRYVLVCPDENTAPLATQAFHAPSQTQSF